MRYHISSLKFGVFSCSAVSMKASSGNVPLLEILGNTAAKPFFSNHLCKLPYYFYVSLYAEGNASYSISLGHGSKVGVVSSGSLIFYFLLPYINFPSFYMSTQVVPIAFCFLHSRGSFFLSFRIFNDSVYNG